MLTTPARGRMKEATFDLTAMIDVVMLLIVFFTLTAQFSRSEQAPLDLPSQAGRPVPEQDRNTIYLDVDKDGTITTLGERIELSAFAVQMVSKSRALPTGIDGLEIVVRADRTAASKHLNSVAKALSAAGISRWKLATALDNTLNAGNGGGK